MITIPQLSDRFEKLLTRLPGAIRKPVENEWRPLKELFIDKRAPRLIVTGSAPDSFIQTVFRVEPAHAPEELAGWHSFHCRGKAEFAIAGNDLREARNAIASAAPDLFLFVADSPVRPRGLDLLRQLHSLDAKRYKQPGPCRGHRGRPHEAVGNP